MQTRTHTDDRDKKNSAPQSSNFDGSNSGHKK